MTIIKKKERASIKGGGGGEHFCKGKVKPAEKKKTIVKPKELWDSSKLNLLSINCNSVSLLKKRLLTDFDSSTIDQDMIFSLKPFLKNRKKKKAS